MSGTDNRIVSMQFDNQEFEKRLSTTLQSLNKLDQTIQLAGAKQGLTAVSDAAGKFSTAGMASSLDTISSKFNALGAIGFSVIQKLTQGVMGFATNVLNMAKTDILSPIITGGKQRATSLEQAKFQFQGLGIDVNAGMASALAAVKGTAYGLDDAASVAAQFGASGIKAGDQMTRALTGISGVAAMTGRSYSEIGQIFTSMAGQGKVSSMDLMEFGIRGVNAAAAYGKETGQTEAQVRALVSAGKVGFPEFADAMDKAFGKHATDANQTYAGSLSNLHAAMSRMGASFFSDRIEQQRDLFNAITPVIDNLTSALKPLTTEILNIAEAGNKRLIAFLDKVDFTKFSRAISNAVGALANASNMVHTYLGIIGTAFNDVFPKSGGFVNMLDSITYFFEYLFKILTPGGSAVLKIQEIFVGLFSTFNIVRDVLKGVAEVLLSFFGSFLGPGAAGASTILEKIARAMDSFDQAFVTTGRIDNFFNHLADLAKKPAEFLDKLVDDIKNLFTTTSNSGSAEASLNRIGKSFDGMSTSLDRVRGVLGTVGQFLDNAWHNIAMWFSELGHRIADSLNPNQFHAALSVIDTALLGGLVLLLKNFMDKGFKLDIGGGMLKEITGSLQGINNVFKSMQTDLKAKTLMEIAGAIAIVTASVVVLSMIKPAALQNAMSALAFGFAQLVIVMKLMDQIATGLGGAAKLTLVSTAMTAMAGAVLTLSVAIKVLSSLGVDGLAKGLGAVGVALGLLVGAAKLMEGSSVGMVAAGLAMNAMATGLVILAGAVRIFATMSWEQLAKGLVGIAGSLVIIALAMKLMPIGSTLAAGLAMIPLAIGLTTLAGAVRLFATMSWAQLAKGLAGLAGGLVIIAGVMRLMPLTLPITAAGLVLVAMAIGLMVPSIKMIGDMNLADLAKGLGGLAAMLLILAVGVNAMDGALGGAAALLVVSGALLVLSGVLEILGHMSWGDLIKGLVAIAGVLLVLGLGAAVLEPLIPALLGLGAALTLIGAGFALFGAGALLFSMALSLIAASAVAAAGAIVAALVLIITAIPKFVTSLVTSLTQSATTLLAGSTVILNLIGQLLSEALALVVRLAPQIAAAIVAIVTAALALIRQKFPDVIQTAFDLLMAFLKSLDDNLPKVIDEATKVVVTFATSLIANAKKLVDAAVNLLLAFLAAIANRAADIAAAGLNLLVKFLGGISDNIGKVVAAAASIITSFVTAVVSAYGGIITAGVNMLASFVSGLGRDLNTLATAATNVAIAFVQGMASNAVRFVNAAADALVAFLNGMASAINTHAPELRAAGLNIIGAIIDGMTGGLASKFASLASDFMNKAKSLVSSVTSFLGISSPSKVFFEIGQNVAIGLANGIKADETATNSAVTQAESIVKAFSDSLSSVPDSLSGISEFQPVIRPVLDLTQVKATASGISDLIPNPSISPELSYAQAHTIASTAEVAKTAQTVTPETKDIKFEQNIYSPEALSTNDIYKSTKSQLAQAKEELNI